MKNEIRYILRYFDLLCKKVSAEKIVWIDNDKDIFFLEYLCRECGYHYTLAIPILLVKETRFAESPVAMIDVKDLICVHIFGFHNYDKDKPLIFRKFQIMGEISALRKQGRDSVVDLGKIIDSEGEKQ